MFNYFKNIFNVSVALMKGMGVTLKYLFQPSVTVQYPFEKLSLSDRYRGALAFHPDICISCEMCVRACPSACIDLEAKRNEETKKKDLKWYSIDFGKCNYCRLCEEICPTKPKAVHHTKEYELTFTDRNDFTIMWTPENPQPQGSDRGQVWDKFMTKIGMPPAADKPAAPPEPKGPAASAV
jgi:NAD(P)H-quinone oxidoreductase subunit I